MVRPTVIGMLAVAVGLTVGCVDQEENATTFCEMNLDRLTTDLEEQGIPAELADRDFEREQNGETIEELENTFSKQMRYAEDATRAVRNAARDVDDAYLDVHATYTDKDSDAEELEEDREELRVALAELREACEAFLPGELASR